MRSEIAKLHKKLQTTFIYVTHDQTEAMTMGTRIVVMRDGIVQQVASPQEIYDNPANIFVAGFIGSPQMNLVDVKVEEVAGKVTLIFGDDKITLLDKQAAVLKQGGYVGKDVVMGIRPEHMDDGADFLAKHPNAIIEANVEVTELMGAESYIYASRGGNNLTIRVNGSTALQTGDKAKFALDVEKVHVFDKETEITVL